jgi:Cu/Ag efflux protein CusF
MKRLIITSMIALIALAGPIATQLQANDAHHPEKTAKAKTFAKAKTKQQKKPATKTDKSKQGETRFGPQERKV